jgi:hypothetical protein
MIAALPVPPVVEILTVQPIGNRWRVTSSDGLFEGVFTDAKSAVRCARAEAEAHPGHVLVLAEPRMAA